MDWGNILLEAGIDIPVHTAEVSMVCPFHDDRVSSLSLNTDKGMWICFAGCGQGTLKSFLQRYLGLSPEEITKYLGAKEVVLDLNFLDVPELETETPIVELPDNFIDNNYPEWIFDRGFTKETLHKWECGTNQYGDLIIPIRDQASDLKGWVTRRTQAVPKYLYSKGLRKSTLLFGGHRIQRTPFVCVTEGSLDTMWLDQTGFPSVAILGAMTSHRQQELLAKLPAEELVLCLDNDDAGQHAKDQLMGCMVSNFVVSYINIPKECKDVQDVRNTDILKELIKNRDIW